MSNMIYRSLPPARGWALSAPPRDPILRRQIYGPILPMEQPGFFARFFRRH